MFGNQGWNTIIWINFVLHDDFVFQVSNNLYVNQREFHGKHHVGLTGENENPYRLTRFHGDRQRAQKE